MTSIIEILEEQLREDELDDLGDKLFAEGVCKYPGVYDIEMIIEISNAEIKILEIMMNSGPYDHNMISIILRQLATKTDTKYADMLVDRLSLTELYGISKQNKRA